MSRSWVDVPDGSPFPVTNLPLGVLSPAAGGPPRLAVAVGAQALDLAAAATSGLLLDAEWARAPVLNPFLARGPATWSAVRRRLTELLTDPAAAPAVEPLLLPLAEATMHLPIDVADYVDFYSSRQHAENVGRLFRPDAEPLTPNWLHLPIGYHGRAGTVVVSGTPVRRPSGQRREADGVVFGPSVRLDLEAEVGFVIGAGSDRPVRPDQLAEHVFGAVLVNDWSARDIQAWEYVPLGPFLGKSFATSVSPWVVPLEALRAARVTPVTQRPAPLPYLLDEDPWALELRLAVRLNGEVISRPPFAGTYWTPGQQLAHLTVNGATLRTGDLFASGTVSGSGTAEQGSLLELAANGQRPLRLADGTDRSFLLDGDTVEISASAPGADGTRIGFGTVVGTVAPWSAP